MRHARARARLGRRAQPPRRALDARLGPLVLVSHGLPYHHGFCGGRGLPNRDAAAEPAVAADPLHPTDLIAAWFAAPDYDGVQHAGISDLASSSTDGGGHWLRRPIRDRTRCTGGREPSIGEGRQVGETTLLGIRARGGWWRRKLTLPTAAAGALTLAPSAQSADAHVYEGRRTRRGRVLA